MPPSAPDDATAPHHDVADFNARLLILEELCFRLKLLPPYPGPSPRDDEDADWDPDATDEAAYAYYRDLPIPTAAAARVESLVLDGGNRTMLDVAPFWDGEDDRFDIRDWSDIARLPNLRQLATAGPLPREHRRLLRAHGVIVRDAAHRALVSSTRTHTVAGQPVRATVELAHDGVIEGLLAGFAERTVEEWADGWELRRGSARFRLGRTEHWGTPCWELRTPDYGLLPLSADGAEPRWSTSTSGSLRLLGAQERCLAAALGPDEAPGPAPDLRETLLVEPGADRAADVVLERHAPGDGDSGWRLRRRGSTDRPDDGWSRHPLVRLWETRPGALPVLALPVGYTVTLDVDDVVAITAPDGSPRATAVLPLPDGGLSQLENA
ncbi:hypothetical protein RM844_09915 [Streptomyces sp. DSM 44915]|uniref:Uncharacterized protein n=1 Tax=Streptomyces chisholmiae TaxID=3075540 RepID=A0ABU2JNQ1_9ACTN|nr:hypothetical protein [Streptomyces sp. DSM 44915]MDT0266609.1 hypothetical protein [Streptomyces sp. DSM 44915]